MKMSTRGNFVLVSIVMSFMALIVVSGITRARLYLHTSFYLSLLAICAWYGVMALSAIALSKTRKRSWIEPVLTVELILGLLGSVIGGDALLKQGGLFLWLFGSILVLFGFCVLLIMLVRDVRRHRRGGRGD